MICGSNSCSSNICDRLQQASAKVVWQQQLCGNGSNKNCLWLQPGGATEQLGQVTANNKYSCGGSNNSSSSSLGRVAVAAAASSKQQQMWQQKHSCQQYPQQQLVTVVVMSAITWALWCHKRWQWQLYSNHVNATIGCGPISWDGNQYFRLQVPTRTARRLQL